MQYLHRGHHVSQAARLLVVRRPKAWTLHLNGDHLHIKVLGQKQVLVQVSPIRDQGNGANIQRCVIHEQGDLCVQVPSKDVFVDPPEGTAQFDQQPPIFHLKVFGMEVDDPSLEDPHRPKHVVGTFLQHIGELEDLATVAVPVEVFHQTSGEGVLPRASDPGDHKDQRFIVFRHHSCRKCVRRFFGGAI